MPSIISPINIKMLSRVQLEVINRQDLRYPLGFAEKDYFLALTLQILYSSSIANALVFKGGTALYHTYLPQIRFSEDLDFTALRPISLDELRAVFAPYPFLTIKKDYQSKATVKIERLGYRGPLGQENALKVEIDFTQNVVLPSRSMPYQNKYGVIVEVSVMDLREIVAEKVRAISQRAKYRDFYDLTTIVASIPVALRECVALLEQKEMRSPISARSIQTNWNIARQEISSGNDTVYYSENISSDQIEVMIGQVTALLSS